MSGQAKPRRLGVSQALEGTLRIGGGGGGSHGHHLCSHHERPGICVWQLPIKLILSPHQSAYSRTARHGAGGASQGHLRRSVLSGAPTPGTAPASLVGAALCENYVCGDFRSFPCSRG